MGVGGEYALIRLDYLLIYIYSKSRVVNRFDGRARGLVPAIWGRGLYLQNRGWGLYLQNRGWVLHLQNRGRGLYLQNRGWPDEFSIESISF